MNIGYFVKFPWYPPKGGAAVHAYQLVRHLAKKGHVFKTIAYWHQVPDLMEVYRQRDFFKFLRDIDVLYIRIHGNWSCEHWTLLKVLKLFRLPVVWEINSPLDEAIKKKVRTEKEVRSMNFRRRLLGKMVNAGICVSDVMKDYAVNYLGIKNAHIVPNGSDPEQFSPEKADGNLYKEYNGAFKVLWSGSAEYPWQGIDIISKVAQRVYALDKDIKFILISNTKYLKKHAIFDKNVIVIEQKPYLEVAPYLASVDTGLCLYHDQGWNGKFYFSPLKLFDYMASGLPVIATDKGQIRQVIKDRTSGLLLDNNIENIVKKIIYLKNNPTIGKQMGAEARRDVERYYNWERVAGQTEEILNSLVSKKRRQQ